jgi:nifR3 family TIM-barrel protein
MKMRLGWSESDLVYLDVAKRAQRVGVQAVTLHARTARQFYRGSADWEHIKRLKAEIDIPVIGNGDLDEPHKALARMRESGVDAIMLGRATLGNPWLIAQIADLMEGREMRALPSHADRLRFCVAHYERMVDELGEARAVPMMRKHVALYLKGVPGGAALREKMMRIPTAAEALAVIRETIGRFETAQPVVAA